MRRSAGALLCLLAALAALLAAAGAGAASLKDPFFATSSLTTGPPVNISAPTVAGATVEGQTLMAASGSWNPSATSVAYQWQRDAGSGFGDISGETGPTYTLVAADVGALVRVHVVATNASGSAPADAVGVGPVIDGDPANTVAPVVTGNLQGGRTLTASAGTWFPAAATYAFQWQRDTGSGFTPIPSATSSNYTTVPADVGATIRARITATNSFASVTVATAGVGPITSGAPANTAVPVISGAAKRGAPLAVGAGTWSPAGTTYAYQWQSDDGSGFADITGAVNSSYTPLGGDIGNTLRVVVTAANAFGSTTATSAATAAVATDPPASAAAPSIAGTAKRTFTLTASAGTWTPAGASHAYQWQRDGGSGFVDISGATSASYTLVAADVGDVVRVRVTATNVDGSTTADSAQTATVVAATPGSTVAPVLTAGNRVGAMLTTSDGSWSPAASSYAYQWQRRVAGTYVDIAGATSRSYTLAAADAGTTVRARVTATNADGSGAGYSAASATVVAPPVAPGTIAAPTGTLVDTNALTIDPGVWTPSSTTFTFQWLRCPAGATALGGCVTIGNGQSYILLGEDVGHTIAVRVTGTAAGVSTVATATFTADVTGRPLTLVTAPAIVGTVQVAQIVRAGPAAWSVPTRTEHYQWQRCEADGTLCVDIPGATQQSYKVTVADKDHALVVHEAATSWGQASTADSAAAVVADQPVPVIGTAPVLTGVAKRAANLQLSRGTWANDPTGFAYSWLRCDSDGTNCVTIAGATRANYILTAADVAHAVRGAVTATNTEGSTTAASAPTTAVQAVLPQLVTVGAITGRMQVPQTIQMKRSTWSTTADTTYAYQWQRCDAAGANCADIAGARSQAYRLQVADARARLRVLNIATDADGSTTAATPVTAVIAPAPPGVQVTPRLTGVGRTDVGKTLTVAPGTWNPATEITAKVLQFWRCAPRCTALATGGAGSYVLTDDDAGAMIRGSETATGPGGTTVAWAPAWLGPVRSPTVAAISFSSLAGETALMSTSRGAALATATVSRATAAARAASASHARDRSVRITLRRARRAPKGTLRAWACLASPAASEGTPCSKAVSLRSRATLTLAVAKGQRVRVVVVQSRKR
ncbi:MAG TPA: hypothetical protein VNT03_15040 [Baekduia sp.]|nr:hypothetical protein [Baekduia sp.]